MTIRDIAVAFGYEVDKNSESKAKDSINGLKSMAKKALGAIGIAISITGIATAIKDCVALASEVEEMENKFNVVFQGMENEVDAWAADFADAIGRNKNDIKSYLADQQNLLVGFGMTREAGADLSKQMTTLALDLASFANLDEATAVNAMTKAVMGQAESAKTLGAVLNETNRAQAMETLGIKGTYDALDQLTKMQVNYQAILSQSPDAIGDCERSLGSYASTLKSFQSKLKELKTMVGQFFIPVATKVLRFGSNAVLKLRDIMTRIQAFVDRCGGIERVLKVVAAAAAAIFVALNFSKITSGLSSISKLLGTINLKALAIIAVIVLIALLVDDFINFMQGNDSVIGSLLEKAGIDTEAVREKIINAWNKIKNFLTTAWNTIKSVATRVWDGLKQFWAEHGEQITNALKTAWNVIKTVLLTVWNIIKTVATTIFNGLKAFWEKHGDQIKTAFSNIWTGIKNVVTTVWNIIKTVAEAIFNRLKAFWDTWGSTIMTYFSGVWETIKAVFQTAMDLIADIFAVFSAVFAGDWEQAWEEVKNLFSDLWNGIVNIFTTIWETITSTLESIWSVVGEKVSGIKDTIVDGFNSAIEWITSLPSKALQWGKDIIQNIIDGIKSKIQAVGDAVSEVADKIAGFLGFSEPEEGPLSDFHTYMPDMIQLMAGGLQRGRSVIRGAAQALAEEVNEGMSGIDGGEPKGSKLKGIFSGATKIAGDISMFVKSAKPAASTVQNSVSNSSNRVITQNINFNQQFNGDAAGQQKSAAAMDKASEDATGALARALAYAS